MPFGFSGRILNGIVWLWFNTPYFEMNVLRTDTLKQFLLLAVIILLVVVLGRQVITFMPGILGAVTLYILLRERYFQLTVVGNWKKWSTAILLIFISIMVFVLPFAVCAQILLPKFYAFLHNPEQLSQLMEMLSARLQRIIPQMKMDEGQLSEMTNNLAATVPGFLSATADILLNLVLAFFLLYFMLVDGRKMERKIQRFLPLKEDNIDNIWEATRVMVVSNAIGIPMLALSQAIVAALGYFIFGVSEALVWGIVTGIFSVLPIVGSAIILAPICVYMIATDHVGAGIGLFLYSVIITSSIDNVLRFTILKKLGDVHPVVTVFGVIVGIPIFGFMGLIFGPLLISYLLLLIRIYRVEFTTGASGNSSQPANSIKGNTTGSNDFLQRS